MWNYDLQIENGSNFWVYHINYPKTLWNVHAFPNEENYE